MRLPPAPPPAELASKIPAIAPVPPGTPRPFWSVMIPTYNSGDFLRRTIRSVLAQDLGPERMHIEVVDGCSTKDDPAAVVEELGRGRIEYHRLDENRGPVYTFNACLQRSRGQWVHVLHGDDLVLPGFYDANEAVIRDTPSARTVFGQSIIIDEHDRWRGLYGPMPPVGGGIIADFAQRQATAQLVLAPGIVARRDAYEAIGGFCAWFDHVIDWDMWARLGHHGPVAQLPRPYAMYRLHSQSHTVTSRMLVTASNTRETFQVVSANLARIGMPETPEGRREWRARMAAQAEVHLWELDRTSPEGRLNQATWAWMLAPTPRRLSVLAKSWLKHKRQGLLADEGDSKTK